MLQAQELKVGTGTIVDATIVGAPSYTKMPTGSATLKCIRRGKVSSGALA